MLDAIQDSNNLENGALTFISMEILFRGLMKYVKCLVVKWPFSIRER